MITIEPLTPAHLPQLVALRAASPPGYDAYFSPFVFDEQNLGRILAESRADQYLALLWGGELAGMAMLRGLDEGYTVPSYGVWVAHPFSGRGLALASLRHAVTACEELGCAELMLKVHPENTRARRIYERFGFEQTGHDARNGNLVLRLPLAQP
jgi:RimJ/RimL family protein N-acetyltransferase